LYGPLAACYTSARPGITGLWQVTARGSEDFGRRIALDCEYARRITLYGDLLILLKTVSVVMSGRGAY
jgi:lipopolysaccharide/colanic/teichoic acid biosynthesis glycosyltransferase